MIRQVRQCLSFYDTRRLHRKTKTSISLCSAWALLQCKAIHIRVDLVPTSISKCKKLNYLTNSAIDRTYLFWRVDDKRKQANKLNKCQAIWFRAHGFVVHH
jgi:hypothetical protein